MNYATAADWFDPDKWPQYEHVIQIYETDQDAVVHFSNYFRIAEEAMFHGLKSFGWALEKSDYSVAMLDASTKYVAATKYGDVIKVLVNKFNIKGIKIELAFELQNQRSECLARTEFVVVPVLREIRKAVPLPQSIKNKIVSALSHQLR